MRVVSTSVEVEFADGTALQLTANFHFPDGESRGQLFFCLPGGGASQGYFNLGVVDGFDYSFVSRMTALGHVMITMDHPGTGQNPLPDNHPFLTPRQASDYLSVAFHKIKSNPDFEELQAIGLGHSMGGMVTTLIQARHRLFAKLVLLGSSARGLDWGTTEKEKQYIGRPDALERDLERLVLERYGTCFPGISGGPSGKSITFGGANPDITAKLRDNMASLFAAGGTTSMIRGGFAPEAAAIDVPMFFAFGEHDIGAPPDEVPQDFKAAPDIKIHLMEGTGHNSFAYPTIEGLCAEIDDWVRR
jgi:pimeloyl-ACP methyl ester carboxylesterase